MHRGALCILACILLTCLLTFKGSGLTKLIMRIDIVGKSLNTQSDNSLSSAVQELAQKCMNPDPHRRPTFAEVLDLLEPIREMVERGDLGRAESFPVYDNSDDLQGKSVSAMLGTVNRIVEEEQKEASPQRLTARQAVGSA